MSFGMNMKVKVDKRKGIVGTDLFRFFDNGIRKRLPKLVAQEYYRLLIRNIENNSFGFVLSKDWSNSKKSRGADPRPFIEYGTYKSAITIKTGGGHLSFRFMSIVHPSAGVTVGKLARLLEYGNLSKGLPARPLWRRTTEQFQREVLKKSLRNHVKNALNGTR